MPIRWEKVFDIPMRKASVFSSSLSRKDEKHWLHQHLFGHMSQNLAKHLRTFGASILFLQPTI